jgi:hypothetical protein
MAKKARLLNSEKGQSIVIVAIVMITMLSLAGLAIDGGNIFLHRRRVQNAADAGAMASTRELAWIIVQCASGNADADSQVFQTLTDYLGTNGYSEERDDEIVAYYVDKDENRLGQVGAGSIPNSATGVEVLIEATLDTYFLQVVGVNSSRYAADATAMTGRVTTLSGGILPIAVPVIVTDELDPGEDFVVMENNQPDAGQFCTDTNHNGRFDEGIDLCIGDVNNDNSHRGWLNLNYIYNLEHLQQDDPFYRTFEQNVSNRGCGSDPTISTDDGIQGWAGDGCPYPYPIFSGAVDHIDGDFIHGSPGARQSSLMEVIETYNNKVTYIPLFDYIYTSDYMAERVEFPDPEGIGWPRAGGGGSAFLYHIVGYTAVNIDDPNLHDHTLAGEFREAVVGVGQINPGLGIGSGICHPLELYGVNLWR